MAIKLGGGGGGANVPYKGSTAEVAHSPVIEGTYYKFNASGKLIADTPVIAETKVLDQTVFSQANSGGAGQSSRDAYPFSAGAKFEGLMPNGNILYPFSRYQSSTYQSIDYVVLDSEGSQLSYVQSTPVNNTYYYVPVYKLEYQGEDSTYYIFTSFTHAADSNNTNGTLRGYTVKVRKSDNAITLNANSDLAYTFNSSTRNSTASQYGGELTFARDKSVYCAIAINGATTTTNFTLELTTGTVNSSYVQANVGTTAIASVYNSGNIQLIKYDDSSANFLLAYQTVQSSSAQGYVVKKVLVAADGSHTVTDITPSGFSQGTGANQQYASYIRFIKSEQAGKYLLAGINGYTQAKYYKVSYDGSSLTLGSLQKYNTATTASSDYFFRGYTTSFHNGNYCNSFIYRYAEDKVYVGPRATRDAWSNYTKGAVWTLGSGDVQGTAVKTDVFDSLSKENNTSLSLISTNSDGLITERISIADSYVVGQTSQFWDVSAKTQKNIAYVRQSGAVGATVNISLIEGVTSSDTLPSTYWLNKEDMYYAFDNAAAVTPAFGYLKLLSNNYAALSVATVNATTIGQDALSIVAPDGKYLIVWRYESAASSNTATCTGVKVDGNSIFTGLNPYNSTTVNSQTYGRIDPNNAPHICKRFSLYRSSSSTEDALSRVYYYIGEPA
tara:strand:+ start:623 stop:2629 length:2007 start_codon:yes stop_codon:yes gene_type:complete